MANNPLLFIGGLAAAIGIGYYFHQAGYFNKIFEALNDAIDKVKETKPAEDKSKEKEEEDKEEKKKESKLTMVYNTPQFWSGSHRAYLITR